MSCDVANGRLEVCKDAIGGIDAVYFFAYEADFVPTYDGTNTDVIDSVAGVTVLYKYELKGANSFEQTANTSRDNGTSFITQTLSLTLKKQDITMHKTFKILMYGRPRAVVRNRNGQYFLAGLERGLDMVSGGAANGTAMGDLNGYTLVMEGGEKILANFIDVATEAALATAFANATITTT